MTKFVEISYLIFGASSELGKQKSPKIYLSASQICRRGLTAVFYKGINSTKSQNTLVRDQIIAIKVKENCVHSIAVIVKRRAHGSDLSNL